MASGLPATDYSKLLLVHLAVLLLGYLPSSRA